MRIRNGIDSMNSNNINLLMAIHCHQPDGNFDWVFAEAYEKSYLPFLRMLSRYPGMKAALHYSGCLLDWIYNKHPEFMDMLKEMVGRGQIEMLAGGYYEPILTLIPERDILGQIKLMKEKITEFTGYSPNGVWLTERVWEPTLIKPLVKAGIRYAIVDDWHFTYVGKNPDDLSGYYVTEDEGEKLFIFPGSEKLRYSMPFKLPHETVNYMRDLMSRGVKSKIFADDGEKFGIWPGTFKWVYEEKWLENFMNAIDAEKSWLNTLTFSEYLAENGPSGRIYLTGASYREMMEWSGGYFKNFLVKYPESNSMQKKMLYLSGRVDRASSKAAREYLYKGQCNCAYWHGVFGGLYLNHLRTAVYSNLIKAQKELDKTAHKNNDWIDVDITDFDCDSYDEILVSNSKMELDISLHNGGSIFEMDFKPLNLNLMNTLSRRKEIYHEKASEKALTGCDQGQQGVASIHEIVNCNDERLLAGLSYDRYRKVSLLDHFLKSDMTARDFAESRLDEAGDFLNGEYEYEIKKTAKPKTMSLRLSRTGTYRGLSDEIQKLKLEKAINFKPALAAMEIEYRLTNLDTRVCPLWWGTEFNYSLKDPHLNRIGEVKDMKNIVINDQWYGVKVDLEFSKPVSMWYFPLETISDSESGLERTYQQLSLLFHWKLELAPSETWAVRIYKEIKTEE